MCARSGSAEHAKHRPGAVAYTGSFSRGVREGVPVSKKALLHRGRSTQLPRERGHRQRMPSGLGGCQGVRAGVQPCRSPDPTGGREQGFARATPVKEPYTGRQECKGNKFPCQETQTNVYLCAISQPNMVQSIDPL